MTDPLRWGVVGVSELVGRQAVLPALSVSPTADLVAVASRTADRARAETARFSARRAYGSYASLLDDAEVEAVYLPLPNALHLEWTLKAAEAGKHVLCEKPLACTASEADAMSRACEAARVVLMEAYMTPFHPRSARMLETVRSGQLGELRFARASFTGPLKDAANHRWRPEMGGGALLDVGIYCLAPLVAAACREPLEVTARAVKVASGVDASFSGWLDFGDGFTAAFETSFEVTERQVLEFVGTAASLSVDRPFTPTAHDTEMRLAHRDGSVESITCGANDPYLAMVEHFAAVVRGTATPLRTPADSVATMGLLDRLRAAAP